MCVYIYTFVDTTNRYIIDIYQMYVCVFVDTTNRYIIYIYQMCVLASEVYGQLQATVNMIISPDNGGHYLFAKIRRCPPKMTSLPRTKAGKSLSAVNSAGKTPKHGGDGGEGRTLD